MNSTLAPIAPNSTVVIVKGCAARSITKGARARVHAIVALGAEHSHMVRVVLNFDGRMIAFYARHVNRLEDAEISMNDGNPTHKIIIRRK